PGFYYKTFKWPGSFWRIYEHMLRGASGLGRAPDATDVDRYDKACEHCDVLVIGGGPAGIAAARGSAQTGARVIIVDDQPELGGRLYDGGPAVYGQDAFSWLTETVQALSTTPEVHLLRRSTVFGYYDHNFLGVIERVSDNQPSADHSRPR